MEVQRLLVIGGTGAQGAAVVKALLEAKRPFQVRIMTRDPEDASIWDKFDNKSGIELMKGKLPNSTGH
jgi:uncharacterized protein YbjT (DUF2867 family)